MSPTFNMVPDVNTGHTRYQMLDVWRGLVCVVVVLEHSGVVFWTGANEATGWSGWLQRTVVRALTWNIGTPLFFVMSGYCIAASLESLRRKGGTPLSFLAKRGWRILPTYWAALLFFFLVVAWLDRLGMGRFHDNGYGLSLASPETLSQAQWLGNITLTETWRPHLSGGMSNVFTRVAWSLCYQEQFYVVCVAALWLAPARVDRFLAIATAVIVAIRVMAWDTGTLDSIFSGTFFCLWHEFAVGLAVYWRLNRRSTFRQRRALEFGLLFLAVVGYQTEFASTLAAGLFGLALIAMHRWDSLAGSLSWLRPVRALGKRSYSIYLIHLPVASLLSVILCDAGLVGFGSRALIVFPVATAGALIAGWVFHSGVESHFLGTPPFLTERKPAAASGQVIAA